MHWNYCVVPYTTSTTIIAHPRTDVQGFVNYFCILVTFTYRIITHLRGHCQEDEASYQREIRHCQRSFSKVIASLRHCMLLMGTGQVGVFLSLFSTLL